MAVTVVRQCDLSDEGLLKIDGVRVCHLKEQSVSDVQKALEAAGVVKQDPAWDTVIKKIRLWYSRQWKPYLCPPEPVRRFIAKPLIPSNVTVHKRQK